VYREDFARQSAAPDWLQSLRRQGMSRFEALGLPTTKSEDWHFTTPAPIAERTFRLAALESKPPGPHSPHLTEGYRRRFDALNTAFISDGAFIELKNDAVFEQPIHLLFVSDGEGVSHPRNLIVTGRHSRAVIIESYLSMRDSNYFTNAVTEIVVGEGAHVDHY